MAEPHALHRTGAKTSALVGGRSRRTLNGVPILELSNEHYEKVAASHAQAVDPDADTEYLVGEHVFMHTPREVGHGGADVVHFRIGGSTLDEAAKECVGAFEDNYSLDPPTWVASSRDDLAAVIADHYGCEVRGMDEDLNP